MFRVTSHTTVIIINYFAVPLQCSVSCGLGTRSREVTCKSLETKLVLPLESCNLALKPKEIEKCNPGPCTVTWLASNWSEVGFQDLPFTSLMSRLREIWDLFVNYLFFSLRGKLNANQMRK